MEMKSPKPHKKNLPKHCQVRKEQAIKNQSPRNSKSRIRNLRTAALLKNLKNLKLKLWIIKLFRKRRSESPYKRLNKKTQIISHDINLNN
jgi:hypothetical protein